MPVITVEAGSLSQEQKEKLAKELTKTASEIMGLPEKTFFTFLKENPYENVAVGGTLLSESRK